MNDFQTVKDTEMERIVQALETAPFVVVPEDFASRLMARVPAQPQRRYVIRRPWDPHLRVGRTVAVAALVMLLAGMLIAAPRTTGSIEWQLLQLLLFAQFAALLLWMGWSYKQLR